MEKPSKPGTKTENSPGRFSLKGFEQFYQTAFNDTREGIAIIAPDGKIAKANPAFLKIHRLSENEALEYSANPGNYFLLYDFNGNIIPLNEWPFTKVLNKKSFHNEQYIVVKKGQDLLFYGSFSGKPMFDESGNFIAGFIYINDITDQVQTRVKLVKEINQKIKNIKEKEHIQRALNRDRKLLQTIIDSIPVMLTIYDENIETVVINRAVETITGWTNQDIEKVNIMELAYPDKKYRQEVCKFMQSLKPDFKDIIMRTKDGRDIETSWANVKIPDGRQVGVGIDISERKKMEKELLEAKKKAEKENRVQSAFIQNISHEVRTPMNSILGFTELLQKSYKGEKEENYLHSIIYNGKQLLRLINDIVDFSRLDKNEMALSKEQVGLNYFIQQTQRILPGLKRKYNKPGIEILVKEPAFDTESITLYTDIYRLQQILSNLISNALKYTEEGEIEIGYEIRHAKQEIMFFVKDTGIGIKSEDHDRVFNRFSRFHDTSGAEFRGTGLGLAICKHLVKVLGGEIGFESEWGEGSTFYFTHPYIQETKEKEDEPKNEVQENGDSLPLLKDKNILVAEDDQYSFMMLKGMLNETKANILHADNGKKALELFENNNIDLVFLDIRLPAMDGYEVIAGIRKKNKTLPVIALTANALPEDKEKSRLAGFSQHATKPISISGLYTILNRFFPAS